jgi:coiled-coil domain-containing protein 55
MGSKVVNRKNAAGHERHTSSMKLSISLAGAKPKAAPAGSAPPLTKPAAFGALEDDASADADAAPTLGSSRPNVAAHKALLAQNAGVSRTLRKRMDAERRVDETVYEYDEVYDKMQEAKERQKAAKDSESAERKVCRILFGLVSSV